MVDNVFDKMSTIRNKEISITNMKIGDLVLGEHVDLSRQQYNIVAGRIAKISKINDNKLRYHIKGITLPRIHGEPLTFSGIINSDEIEIANRDTYEIIMKLYNLANEQIVTGTSYQETVAKITKIRHKSRQKLEKKIFCYEI